MSKLFIISMLLIYSVVTHAQLFVEKTVTNQVTGSKEIHVADIDGDGNDDVLNINRLPNSNFVWLKNIDNAQNFENPIEIGNIGDPSYFTTADIDGDGDLDVVGTRLFQPNDRLVWFENLDGLGNFGTPNDILTITEGQAIVKAADLDGDLDIDLIVNSRDDGALSWYENLDGLGNFGPSQIIITNYVTFTALAIGDIDVDGDIDLVAGTNTLHRMAWFENIDGLGSFSAPNPVSTPGLAITFVGLADIDGDNNLDIFGTGGDTVVDIVAWWKNIDGLGTFSSENYVSTKFDVPFKMVSADLDNDLDTDLAITVGIDDAVYWFENTDGDGNFGSEQLVSDNLPFTISLAVSDLDNDGDLDLLSAPQTSNTIYWYENKTILNVTEQQKITVSVYPNPVQDVLFISSPNCNLSQITIIDTLGKTIFETKKNIDKVNVSRWSSGVYIVKMQSESGIKFVKKFVKD